jgi:hypothetical protein
MLISFTTNLRCAAGKSKQNSKNRSHSDNENLGVTKSAKRSNGLYKKVDIGG